MALATAVAEGYGERQLKADLPVRGVGQVPASYSHSLALSDRRLHVGYASHSRRSSCAAGGMYVARSRYGARDVIGRHYVERL